MTCTRELTPWPMSLTLTNTDESFLWDPQWYPCTGVSAVDFVADVRNRVLGASAAMSLKPAIQLAQVRTDRPAAGAAVTAGSVITAAGVHQFRETLSAGSYLYFRRGLSYQLTSGSFARCDVLLYTSFRSCGRMFQTVEIIFQPTNDTAAVSYFPLTGVFSAVGVDSAKLGVVGLDNLTATLELRLAGRAFNDEQARGSWVDLPTGGSWTAPGTGDFTPVNTGEVSLSGLSLSGNHWMELALAVRKQSNSDPNSRVILRVTTAVKYA